MKSLSILLLISSSLSSLVVPAQSKTDSTSEPISYTDIVKVDSVSKEELFNRARSWFNTTFKDSKSVLNIQDASTGELSGKGAMEYKSGVFVGSAGTSGWINFQISVFVKEGRYKYAITNFVHEGSPTAYTSPYNFNLITTDSICPIGISMTNPKWRNKVWSDIKLQVDADAKDLVLSLQESMLKPSASMEKW